MDKELTTLFTGRHCLDLKEVDSTNTYLSGLLRRETLPEGAVVRARKQVSGKGQAGTSWESQDSRNLLLSFVFYPSFILPRDVFILNKALSLGVHDFASHHLGDSVSIKWPNDIYWKNKKIGGLLIENSITSNTISTTVFGVGININQKSFSAELPNPSSFAIITGKEFNLDQLFFSFCSFIESRYLQLKRGDVSGIDRDYLSSLYKLGMKHMFVHKSGIFKGTIVNVDEGGRLIIQAEDGSTRKFDLKEIRFVVEET